jgi:DNA polymerase-1
LDGDNTGAAQAIQWWELHFSNACRLAYPKKYAAKDPTELAIAAGDVGILRAWVDVGIDIAQSRRNPEPVPEPVPVPDQPKVSNRRAVRKLAFPPSQPEAQSIPPARSVPGQSSPKSSIEVGASFDMRTTVVSDATGAETAVARIAAFDGVIGLDTETTPLPAFVGEPKAALDPFKSVARTMQVATDDGVVVFDLKNMDIRELAPLAVRPWVGHNSVFDLKVLAQAGLMSASPDCTMLQANSLFGGLASLRDLASKHLGVDLDKGEQTSDWSGDLSNEQVEYAARDAWATLRLHRHLTEQVERRDRTRLYGLLRGAGVPVAHMELSGIGLDTEAHAQLVDEWRTELDMAQADVRTAFGDGFNPNSSKQVGALLQEHLDPETLAAWPKTKSGGLSTTADDIALLANHPALARIAAARGLAHALAHFGESLGALVHPVTGRVHPHLMIATQSTGRFSCTGPNMHGVPRDPRVRSLFVAEPGRAIVSADFGMVQLRIAALVSRDPRLVEATERGADLHRLTASLLMSKAPEEVTGEERSLVKPVNFGLLFCMGAPTLWRYARANYGVQMSLGDAARFRDAYFRAYPGIRAWHRRIGGQLDDCGKVCTPCGRWSMVPKLGSLGLPAAAAHVIQGAEAEVMLASIGRLPGALRGLDAVPVGCIHDELLLDVAESDVPAAEAAVRSAMECGMRDVFPNAPLIGLVEAKHGPNWHAAK